MPVQLITVPTDSETLRLDRFLASVLPETSRSQIQKLIEKGLVRVDSREARANQSVKPGQAIAVELPEPVDSEVKPEALDLPIVYEDRDLVVVDKPAGMVVHPAAGH